MNSKAFTDALNCLPSLESDSLADVPELVGEEGNIQISPREEHIKLEVLEEDLFDRSFLALQLIQLRVQVPVN